MDNIKISEIYNRSELLLGSEVMERMRTSKVIIFGVGGVGSWCAESLIRTGIVNMTIVDSDCVCTTNINRQLMATTKTVGQLKVDALRNRLLDINPEAEVKAIPEIFTAETADDFHLEEYDFIIDAIDSLKDKAELILRATAAPAGQHGGFFSSMGAALKLDPTKIRVEEFWKVKGDPLARALRNKFKHTKNFPTHKFKCVYSEEIPLPNLGLAIDDGSNTFTKVQTNGSLAHITAIFGMTLSGMVVKSFLD